jgi:hypothetical protein
MPKKTQKGTADQKKTESCEAWLYFEDYSYAGKTGKNHGHAEMDALHQYLDGFDDLSKAVNDFDSLSNIGVYCPSRPVCLQCGAVLKELGFEPRSNGASKTIWGNKCMGSTEWGCSLKVREFLELMGINYQKIVSLRG